MIRPFLYALAAVVWTAATAYLLAWARPAPASDVAQLERPTARPCATSLPRPFAVTPEDFRAEAAP